jgi:hypothetical protein
MAREHGLTQKGDPFSARSPQGHHRARRIWSGIKIAVVTEECVAVVSVVLVEIRDSVSEVEASLREHSKRSG